MVFKVYQKGVPDMKFGRERNATFFAAKRSWKHPFRDFPVTQAAKKRLLPHAFDGDARIVFEEFANANLIVSVDDLCDCWRSGCAMKPTNRRSRTASLT